MNDKQKPTQEKIRKKVLRRININNAYPLDNVTIKESKIMNFTIQEARKEFEQIVDEVYKNKELFEWVRHFVAHGHGQVIGRITAKREKCAGCDEDTKAIIYEVLWYVKEKLKVEAKK